MPSDASLRVTIALSLLLVTWGGLTVSETLAHNFNLAIFLLANFVVCSDLIDFGVRLYLRQVAGGSGTRGWRSPTSVALDIGGYTPFQKRVHLRPYAFVVSVYNAEAEIDDFMTAMAPYRDRFWIIDDGSTDRTCKKLRQAGWRCVEGGRNRKKPAALQMLLTSLPPAVETVIVVDPDFAVRDLRINDVSSLETALFDFQQSGMSAFCPRIAIKRDGLLARFQAFEYCMSFSLGRRSLASHGITSGASIYRRSALASVLRSHSLSVYGEDLENSTILLGAGHRIYYDARLVLETEGKREWRGWFSQRVGWSYGLIGVYMRHPRSVWNVARRSPSAAYHYLFYTGVLVLLLHPLRVISTGLLGLSFLAGLDLVLALGWMPDGGLAHPSYFLAAMGSQTLLATTALFLAVPREDRLYLAPIVPLYMFYALVHVVPITFGYLNWFSLRLWGRRVWGDHYQDEASLRAEVQRWRTVALGDDAIGANHGV